MSSGLIPSAWSTWRRACFPAGGVHMLGTSAMLEHVSEHPDGDFIIATETGMLHPLRKAAPRVRLTAANPKARVQVHEDDHTAQAGRLTARAQARGEDRRYRRTAPVFRSSTWWQSADLRCRGQRAATPCRTMVNKYGTAPGVSRDVAPGCARYRGWRCLKRVTRTPSGAVCIVSYASESRAGSDGVSS